MAMFATNKFFRPILNLFFLVIISAILSCSTDRQLDSEKLRPNLDLKGQTLAILRLGFISRAYAPRNAEGDQFRVQFANRLTKAGILVVPLERVAMIQARVLADKSVDRAQAPREIARLSKAAYYIAGQAFIKDNAGQAYVHRGFVWLFRTSDGARMAEFSVIGGKPSLLEFSSMISKKFIAATIWE